MEKAKITLIGPLSLAVGRFRFTRGVAVSSTDKELIRYARVSPRFKVEELPPDEESKGRVKKASARLSRKVKKTETAHEVT